MSEININVDQLNTVYSDGLPNYSSAITNFGEGMEEALKSMVPLSVPGVDLYLENTIEMSSFLLDLTYQADTLLKGYEVFSDKIAYFLLYLKSIDDTLDLNDYPELAQGINAIRSIMAQRGFDINDSDSIDSLLRLGYEEWLRLHTGIKSARDALLSELGDLTELDAEKIRELLLSKGLSQEEVDSLLDYLDNFTVDNTYRNIGTGIAAVALIFAISKNNAAMASSVAGDQFWNWTDTPEWLLNTPLDALFKSFGSGNAAGALASFSIGTLIAFNDGEFDSETWMREAFPAIIGSIVGTVAGGPVVLSALIGLSVTFVIGKLIEGFYEMPGGIPHDFDAWDENEKKDYIRKYTGIDLDKIEQLKVLADSGTYTEEEIKSIFDYCTDVDKATDPSCNDPALVAFYIYTKYKDQFDYYGVEAYGSTIENEVSIHSGLAGQVMEVRKYIERYRRTLKNR